MGKTDGQKAGKNDPGRGLHNTQQTESYRQQMKKEAYILAPRTKMEITKATPYFTVNNNYMAYFRKDDGKDLAESQKIDPLDDEKFYKSLPFHQVSTNEYCPKCKRDKSFCPHKMQQTIPAKEVLKFPLTSSQSIGWREPIDNLNLGLGLKNTFPEGLMGKQQFRQGSPKKEKK